MFLYVRERSCSKLRGSIGLVFEHLEFGFVRSRILQHSDVDSFADMMRLAPSNDPSETWHQIHRKGGNYFACSLSKAPCTDAVLWSPSIAMVTTFVLPKSQY